MKTKIKLYLIAALVIIALSLILSQKANPDFPPLFYLKRIQEKAFIILKFGPKDKVEYMSSLLDNRLEELSEPVRNKNYKYVLPSSLRYFTLAGQITELIISNNLKGYVEQTKQKFLSHQKILYDLYVLYPKNTDDTEYKYIEDDINYLKLYLDKLAEVK